MKHDIQERIATETAGITTEQLVSNMRRGAEAFRRTHATSTQPLASNRTFTALFLGLEIEQGQRGNL